MRQSIAGIIRLTRYREYMWFVVVSTCLGLIAAYGPFDWRLAVVFLANELAVGFAFMINDVEDAADDAADPAKAKRNPVSAGILAPRPAYLASFAVAALSAGLFATLGRLPLLVGGTCLLIAFLYSWKPVRLKAIPFVDLVSHALMLAGLQFAAAYVTYAHTFGPRFFWPFLMAFSISMYGELFNELRDLAGDLRAGVTHTASLLGAPATRRLAIAFLSCGLFAAFVVLFVVHLLPYWVIALLAALALLLLLRPMLRFRHDRSFVAAQAPFQKPVEIAAAVALVIRVIGPWLNTLWNTLLNSTLGLWITSAPWTQHLLRVWQFQSEQLLRLF